MPVSRAHMVLTLLASFHTHTHRDSRRHHDTRYTHRIYFTDARSAVGPDIAFHRDDSWAHQTSSTLSSTSSRLPPPIDAAAVRHSWRRHQTLQTMFQSHVLGLRCRCVAAPSHSRRLRLVLGERGSSSDDSQHSRPVQVRPGRISRRAFPTHSHRSSSVNTIQESGLSRSRSELLLPRLWIRMLY
jgi:hypothetical protein